MIANSSTFRPHPGRGIRDMFRKLRALWHGTEALVYGSSKAYLGIVFGRIASGVPWHIRLRCQCSSRISAGAGLGRGSLK